MSHHIIEASDLHYTYPGGARALQGISFRILHGESVGIVGANGAGKSTLLLLLGGCLTPESGAVRIGGYPLTEETLPAVRRSVGMVFQDPDDQLFMPTVWEDVAFGPKNLNLPEAEIETRCAEALETVEATRLRDRPPYRLSGGEKRAAAIATVLSMSPDVLVMDEPTSNLDPRNRRHIIDLLKRFTHTKIVATHDLDLVLDACERVLILHEGRIAADGPTRQLFADPKLLDECHLEKPLRMQACPVCGGK